MKNILFVASECVPFIKTGGLADTIRQYNPETKERSGGCSRFSAEILPERVF